MFISYTYSKCIWTRTKEKTCYSHGLLVSPQINHAALQKWSHISLEAFVLISICLCLPAVCLKAEKCGQERRAGVVIILAAKDYKLNFKKCDYWPCREKNKGFGLEY